jgi:hypothetical protein
MGLAKARYDIKTNRALAEFVGMVGQGDLLPTYQPDEMQKPKWAQPNKSHDKASKRIDDRGRSCGTGG